MATSRNCRPAVPFIVHLLNSKGNIELSKGKGKFNILNKQ
jgi:hypothetical protein